MNTQKKILCLTPNIRHKQIFKKYFSTGWGYLKINARVWQGNEDERLCGEREVVPVLRCWVWSHISCVPLIQLSSFSLFLILFICKNGLTIVPTTFGHCEVKMFIRVAALNVNYYHYYYNVTLLNIAILNILFYFDFFQQPWNNRCYSNFVGKDTKAQEILFIFTRLSNQYGAKLSSDSKILPPKPLLSILYYTVFMCWLL